MRWSTENDIDEFNVDWSTTKDNERFNVEGSGEA